MPTTILDILLSKKGVAFIVASLFIAVVHPVLAHFGVDMLPNTDAYLTALTSAFLVGQGIADHGKGAAQVNAAAAGVAAAAARAVATATNTEASS